jgi:hypothetical protein
LSYRITVRRGPKVERDSCDTLDDALALVERHAREASRREAIEAVGRRYEPGDLVAARIEIKGPGGRAGVDVRGDGSLVAYTGRVRRRTLEGKDPLQALRQALTA